MKLFEKIFYTIIFSIFTLFMTNLFVNYLIALFQQDDDLMFYAGFTIMVITCLFVLILIISSFIAVIWENRNKRK